MKSIKKKENKRKTRLMLNIEKYKNTILNSNVNNITCCVNYLIRKDCYDINCSACKERALKWLLSEYKEPILDDAERKYLADVIRPFREEVDTISKFSNWSDELQYIYISMKTNTYCTLPFFPKNTMYKSMEVGRHYSLKELGL